MWIRPIFILKASLCDTRFETEAKGNSEIAYQWQFNLFVYYILYLASATGIDDQGSRTGSQLNDLDGSRTERRGRVLKKEKTDLVRRPRTYHSKLIGNLQFDPRDAKPLISSSNNNNTEEQHLRGRVSDNTGTSVQERREASIDLTSNVNYKLPGSEAFDRIEIGSSNRPVSSGPQLRQRSSDLSLPDIWRSSTPQLCTQHANLTRESPQALVRELSSRSLIHEYVQQEELPGETSESTSTKKRVPTPNENKISLISLYDLQVVQRLPVTSAFSFSYYELPHQQKVFNESIGRAVKRIGRRKKGNFRSRSVPWRNTLPLPLPHPSLQHLIPRSDQLHFRQLIIINQNAEKKKKKEKQVDFNIRRTVHWQICLKKRCDVLEL